jgi:hypothetical protein
MSDESTKKSSRPETKRLADALALLICRVQGGVASALPTVSELCRLAKVPRNEVYRYHPSILAALRQCRDRATGSSSPGCLERRHVEIRELRDQQAKLVALVDHFYAAYREARALLDRRERELAELRRRLARAPTAIHS